METKITALGDMHNGKQTCLIRSETETYISKPRSSKTEEAFELFCQKLEKLGMPAFARAPRIIRKGEEEHIQAVEINGVTDKNGVRRYYERAGALLFFAYLLGSYDLHCENLFANEDMPVLIDLETLLSGTPRGASGKFNLTRSVMRSHLLCNFISGKRGAVDVSGFSGVTAELKNIPHTQKGKAFLWDYREVFTDSFDAAYRFALENKEALAEAVSVFDRCEFRQILRPTKTYAAVSAIAAKSESGKRELVTALLSKAYENDTDANRLETARLVLQSEVEAVLASEIPLFYSYGNETALYCNKQKVLNGHLSVSPVGDVLMRLDSLSLEDLKRQRDIIKLAVDASVPLSEPVKSVFVNTGSLCAGEITADAVSNCAIDGLRGAFCGLQSDRNGNVDFVSYGYSLYSGLSGILCMYASLFRKTCKPHYRTLLYKYYENIRQTFLRDGSEIVLTNKNCSLADGITGIVSCLEHIGCLIEEETFVNDAKAISLRLGISQSLTDVDYLNGVGALLPVLKRLNCENAVVIGASLYPIFAEAEPFTTGVAHGSGGLALSLCALNALGLSPALDDKILSVLQWENSHYSVENNNWFDLRDKTKKGFMSGWCSGASGIGMARKYIKKNTNDPRIKKLCEADMEKAVCFLTKQTASKKDVLCCGAASRLMAASALGVRIDGIYSRLCRAEKNNELRITHIADTNDRNVSLMQGLSGIAYALAMYGDEMCGGMLI